MLSSQNFSELLHDLGQIEKGGVRSDASLRRQGEVILGAFLRHTSFDGGAVYLKDWRGPELRLAAKSDAFQAPPKLSCDLPASIIHGLAAEIAGLAPQPQTLVPLRHAREDFGLVALTRKSGADESDLGVDLLGAASTYLAALLTSQRMASEVKEGDFQLKYRLWELESLYDIGLSIASTLDRDKIADEILVRTLSLLNARRAALYLRQGDRFALQQSFGDVRSQFFDEELGPEHADRLLKDGIPIAFESGANCIFPSCDSFVALPIRSGTDVIGVLAAADRELRDGGVGPFEPSDIQLLSRFANQAAIALENARLHREALEKQAMEREFELAATIQRDILPRSLPKTDPYEVATLARPARQVGGDYHAFFEHEGKLSICVADVAGKSVPAAILVSAFHAALQLLFEEGRDLGEIVTELNRHIHRWSAENKFITLVIATIDPEAETVRYVNAGHNPCYLVIADQLEQLKSHGLPIGMMSQTRYSAQTRRFPTGSLIVLYSDGITEAENMGGDEFENNRLEAVLKEHAADSVAKVRDAIVAAVDDFVGTAPQKDDQTLVIVRSGIETAG